MSVNNKTSLLIVAFLIILAEILVIAFVVDGAKKRLVSGLITQNIETRRVLGQQLSKILEIHHQSLEDQLGQLSQRTEIMTGGKASCQEELERVFPYFEDRVDNLVRVDKEGNIYCATNKTSLGINISRNEHFKRIFEDEEHKTIMHRVTYSPVSNEFVVGMHKAVYSEKGEFLGTIGAATYISKFQKRYFNDIEHANENRVTLIDDNGDLLFSPSPEAKPFIGKNLLSEDILKLATDESVKTSYIDTVNTLLVEVSQGRTGVSRMNNLEGSETVAVYYPVEVAPDRYWAVAINVPTEEIVNQIEESSLIGGLKSYTSLLLAMIVIVLVTQVSLFGYLIMRLKGGWNSTND